MADVQIAVIDQQNTEVTVAVPGIQGIQGQTGDVAVAQDGTAALPGIRFQNDTNTGIYRPGADQLAISTNGTGRLLVQPGGSVELPACGLVFAGSRLISADVNTGYIALLGGNTTGANIELYGSSHASLANLSIIDADELRIRAANGTSERLRITSDGKVGIGTSLPTQTLSVHGNANDTIDETTGLFKLQSTGGNGLLFGTLTSAPYPSYIQSAYVIDTSIAQYSLLLNPLGGNVGIGTTSPAELLQVQAGNIFVNGGFVRAAGSNASAVTSRGFRQSIDGTEYLAIYHDNTGAVFNVNSFERARIDSSGRLLVGTSTSIPSQYSGEAKFQIAGTGFYNFSCQQFSNDTFESIIVLGKSRSSSIGVHAIVQNGDTVGSIRFEGSDGTGFRNVAQIVAQVDGTPGANDMPGRLVFGTTPDGSATPVERMRIKSSGIINFSNAPVYADNTAALAGGLVAGDVYRKSDGTLMITY